MIIEQDDFNRNRAAYEAQSKIVQDIRYKHATAFLRDHFGRLEIGPRNEEVERLRRSFPLWKERAKQMLNTDIGNYSMHVEVLDRLDYPDLRIGSIGEGLALEFARREVRQDSGDAKKIDMRIVKQIEISDIIEDSKVLDREWNYDGEETAERIARELFPTIQRD